MDSILAKYSVRASYLKFYISLKMSAFSAIWWNLQLRERDPGNKLRLVRYCHAHCLSGTYLVLQVFFLPEKKTYGDRFLLERVIG